MPKYINKPDYTNNNLDIEKSSPTCIFKQINKKNDYNLNISDIEKAKPFSNSNYYKRRSPFNPLDPKYNYIQNYIKNNIVASTDSIGPVIKSKFIRNNLDVSDIQLSSNALKKRNCIQYVNSKDVIDKSFPKMSLNYKKSPYANKYIDYSDVYMDNSNFKNKKFKTNRVVNPLEPNYIVSKNNR